MKKFVAFLDKLEEYTLIGGLFALLVMVFVQVVTRYFFSITLNWIEETARFLFLWLVWLGAGFAAKCRAHLRIEAFVSKLAPNTRYRVELFALLIWIGFAIFLAWSAGGLTMMLIRRHQLSPVLQISMAWAYAAVPVGVGIMVFRLICQLIDMLKNKESFINGVK